MEDHSSAPNDITVGVASGAAAATHPAPPGGLAAQDPADTQDDARNTRSRYLTCTVLGCIASFGMGLALGTEGWHVPRSTVAGGVLLSALAGGLAGAYGLRRRQRFLTCAPKGPAEQLFQVTHEDVIGDILQPLNQLNRELRRDVKSGRLDHGVPL
jgi:hypothetical protein